MPGKIFCSGIGSVLSVDLAALALLLEDVLNSPGAVGLVVSGSCAGKPPTDALFLTFGLAACGSMQSSRTPALWY